MKFSILSELSYQTFSASTFIFNIHAARSANQVITGETLLVDPPLNFEAFELANNDARFIRLAVDQPTVFTLTYRATADVQYRIIGETELLRTIPVYGMHSEVLPYLYPSRHCQSDKLRKFCTKEFGHLPNPYAKASAISEWIFKNIDYISGTTDSGTSAYDTLIQREGVCKDFAHLGIALCRSADIPARYIAGYGYKLYPHDFHACFEAYIGGNWIFFDPTRLVPANGLVKIANSRDAADAAVANFFGNVNCTYVNVQCFAAEEEMMSFEPEDGGLQALSYQ